MNEHTAKMTPNELRQLLDRTGLTRDQVAQRLGIGQRTIYVWLAKGISRPLTAESVRRALQKAKENEKEHD